MIRFIANTTFSGYSIWVAELLFILALFIIGTTIECLTVYFVFKKNRQCYKFVVCTFMVNCLTFLIGFISVAVVFFNEL